MRRVTVVDYGIGNLFSVCRALEHCQADVLLTDTAAGIDAARFLILPGVGAFADGMKGLSQRGLVPALRNYAKSGRPLLGICLGMQMLLDWSDEFGTHEGLGIIPGKVIGVPALTCSGKSHKIPHIGWSALQMPCSRKTWTGTILADVEPGAATYFLHSFMAAPTDPADRLADAEYDGATVSAAIARGRVSGCQFHPEKSGEVGFKTLRRFVALID
jgi:glutamine amidotransferase